MTWTICWNSEYLLINTLLVSGIILYYLLKYPYKVKILLISDNQPVTKEFNYQVGTSETTRPLSYKDSNIKYINERERDKA
jgi:hypothetical protein